MGTLWRVTYCDAKKKGVKTRMKGEKRGLGGGGKGGEKEGSHDT